MVYIREVDVVGYFSLIERLVLGNGLIYQRLPFAMWIQLLESFFQRKYFWVVFFLVCVPQEKQCHGRFLCLTRKVLFNVIENQLIGIFLQVFVYRFFFSVVSNAGIVIDYFMESGRESAGRVIYPTEFHHLFPFLEPALLGGFRIAVGNAEKLVLEGPHRLYACILAGFFI